jgi:hypothetical protein
MRKFLAMCFLATLVNTMLYTSCYCTCSQTCVRIYAVASYTANVADGWGNGNGWLETQWDSSDYGTSCSPGGAAVQLTDVGVAANCNLAVYPNGDYNSAPLGNPGNVHINVNPCSACVYGG